MAKFMITILLIFHMGFGFLATIFLIGLAIVAGVIDEVFS
jgi:hypothetical protein